MIKRSTLLAAVGACLVLVAAAVLAYPRLMVAPGPLRSGHASIANDCFSCHAPLRGPSAERCISCHAVAGIGLRNAAGAPLVKPSPKAAFHQHLARPDCMGCHRDHSRPLLTHRSPKQFSHALLKPESLGQCASCHKAPANAMHPDPKAPCATCHTPAAWKPASFDHARYFVLDRDHNVACTTCHTQPDYKQVSCFGCHEHTPANIRAKHEEEGVAKFERCAECHRSASGHPEGGGERKGGSEGGRKAKGKERD